MPFNNYLRNKEKQFKNQVKNIVPINFVALFETYLNPKGLF